VIHWELFSASTPTELASLVLAFVLSAVIGFERQRRLKSAGLRTHTLVGLGAAVFTLVSAYGFSNVIIGSEVVLDPSRIAAQIVTGVGFLGAGVIFVRQNVVNGLTTAASIWVTAAVGMACGAGMPIIAVTATLLHLTTVVFLTLLGRKLPGSRKDQVLILRYSEGMGVLRVSLLHAVELGFDASLTETKEIARNGKPSRIEATVLVRGTAPIENLVRVLAEVSGMKAVQIAGNEVE
jgi:putative Mg2+ transporter-C (MgtC) family protein